jgi:hypothetical protein
MTRRRLRNWATLAIALSVALWVLQAVIARNYYDEGTRPWPLLAVQWLALVLVLGSLGVLMWTLTRSGRREA